MAVHFSGFSFSVCIRLHRYILQTVSWKDEPDWETRRRPRPTVTRLRWFHLLLPELNKWARNSAHDVTGRRQTRPIHQTGESEGKENTFISVEFSWSIFVYVCTDFPYNCASRSLPLSFFLILLFWAFLRVFWRPPERVDANLALLCAMPDTVGVGEGPGLVAL